MSEDTATTILDLAATMGVLHGCNEDWKSQDTTDLGIIDEMHLGFRVEAFGWGLPALIPTIAGGLRG